MITKLIQKKTYMLNFSEEDLSKYEQRTINIIHEVDLEHLFKINLSDLLNFGNGNDLCDNLDKYEFY